MLSSASQALLSSLLLYVVKVRANPNLAYNYNYTTL